MGLIGLVLYFLHNGFWHGNGAIPLAALGGATILPLALCCRDLVIFIVLSLKYGSIRFLNMFFLRSMLFCLSFWLMAHIFNIEVVE